MADKIRWGIAGSGNIADVFVEDLKLFDNVEIAGACSRQSDNAKRFMERHNLPKYYNSYIDLAHDPSVDIVYVASPHTLHYEHADLFLNNGKGVLLEKPFTVNAEEAGKIMDLARKYQKILMEGMWTRFQPAIKKVKELLEEETIGEIQNVYGSFCFSAEFDPSHRLFDLQLGGGALLDVGVYPISLIVMLLGRPKNIQSFVRIGQSGVDESAAIIFEFDDKKFGTINTSIRAASSNELVIMGTEGYIKLHPPIYRSERITVSDKRWNEEVIDVDIKGKGFYYEIEEMNRCFKEDLAESPIMPHRETVRIMKVLDSIRKQWHLSYPSE